MSVKVVILPGNGGGDVEHANWYGWLRDKLCQDDVIVDLRNMPDPVVGRASKWLPYMEKELMCDVNTIIVGHSTGAIAALRYAETHKVKGIVLVSAYVTDLGMEMEKESGYFDESWEWEKIKENCSFIVQFGSTDDPFIPWSEMQEVADNVKADLKKYSDKGHFMTSSCPEILKVLKDILKKEIPASL